MTNIDPSLPTDEQPDCHQQQQQQQRKRSRHSSSSPNNNNNNTPNHHELSSLDPTLSAINDSMAADNTNLLRHAHTPKRKRDTELAEQPVIDQDHHDDNPPSLDTLQLAHLITSIQAHPHSPNSVPIENASNSHMDNYNSLPNYLLPPPSTVEPEWKEKFEVLLKPLKLEISRLRSRIEILEDERLVMAREITSLKGSLNIPSDLPTSRSFAASTHQTPLSTRDLSRSAAATMLNNSTLNHTLDIPVGPLPEVGTSQAHLCHPSQAHSCHREAVAQALAGAKVGIPQPVINQSSKFETGLSSRRQSTRKKSEASSHPFNTPPSSTPSQATSNRAKHRKPELSRTVRATVFRLMGVSSSHSPISSDAGMSNESCKFGNEKSRAYHGYTTSPCFPEYDPGEIFDPITNSKVWRWDWSKTIRQSQNNTNFAKEIRNVIVREAADPVRPMHTEVPPGDWLYLDDAIDSAYTNMRRERDNLIDPNKMVKKEVHRARNKKRGLKEDKYKRRRKALDEYRADPHSFGQRLREADLRLAEKPTCVGGSGAVGNGKSGAGGDEDKSGNGEDEERWDDALDIKYMSSEDEANVNDFENPIPIGTDKADNTLATSDKVFAICRPTWRSDQVQNLFSVLDTIKQPERAYRRVMGPVRHVRPPLGTPSWMINEASSSLDCSGPPLDSPCIKTGPQPAPIPNF